MHYVGMSAYLLPGAMVWHPDLLLASIALGAVLGAASHHRIAKPVTRLCWMGGAILMVLAICTMHFTAMGAIEIQLSPLIEVSPQLISDETMAILVMSVTGALLLVGFASLSIELNIEHDAQSQLRFVVAHDPLTNLPNRLRLNQMMTEFSERLEEDQTENVAVLTIDISRFKDVNDLYGHETGDVVLKVIADRISDAIQPEEFVARAGGDEFIALKRDFQRIDQVMAFACRLHALINEPIAVNDVCINAEAAIGIATTLDDGGVILELLNKSDLAMYRAKTEPEKQTCLFNAQIDHQSQDKLLLISDLRQAVDRGELSLAYQLQNDLTSLEPIGFEALLRWNHPTRGPVGPDVFIPIAEETGLIRQIGLWVLAHACKEAVQWPKPYSIAVNVAPQQLIQPSFLDHVAQILTDTGLAPERLELEVTEASIIDDQVHTLKVMHKLKAMGVRIAMDDFGTGYSSLATLQAFPFDKIKIDRSFVKDVHVNHQRAAIVRATLLLGAALDIPVLAEGVEVLEELAFLQSESCTAVQGFYFGKPMCIEDLRSLIGVQAMQIAS